MAAYDPQKTRNRPVPTTDRPAPVDAFLDAMPPTRLLPDGVDIAAATEIDLPFVETMGEEILIDTTPRTATDSANWSDTPIVQVADSGRSKLMFVVVAVGAALIAVLVLRRKRR